jgi:hypothetical protein
VVLVSAVSSSCCGSGLVVCYGGFCGGTGCWWWLFRRMGEVCSIPIWPHVLVLFCGGVGGVVLLDAVVFAVVGSSWFLRFCSGLVLVSLLQQWFCWCCISGVWW